MDSASVDGFIRSLFALVAVSNVIPILPVVRDYTAELEGRMARSYQLQALFQGNLVGLGFVFGAPLLLGALSLTVDDLRVAGGVILLAYATRHPLVEGGEKQASAV